MKIIVYHGTDCSFDEIDLTKCLTKRDFGIGFYTTTISSQAESWAKNKKIRNHSNEANVYVYEADIPDDMNVKIYDGLTLDWLDMVKENREKGGVQHSFDIIIGPIANDDTMVTVTRYIQGIYSAEEAINRLKYSKVNDQVSFHTKKALKCLKLIRRYSLGE